MKFSLVILLCLGALVAVTLAAKIRRPIYIVEDNDDESEDDAQFVEEYKGNCAWVLDRECPRGSIKYRYPFYNYGYVYCCEKFWYPYAQRSAKR